MSGIRFRTISSRNDDKFGIQGLITSTQSPGDRSQPRKAYTQRSRQRMAIASSYNHAFHKLYQPPQIFCKKKEKDRGQNYPYKVIEVTPPPKNLGIRCFPPNLQCGESVTIEGQTYTISAVTHRYQLRRGRYEPSEKRLDVLSTGRYILNLYLQSLLDQS